MVTAQEAPAYIVIPGSCLDILSSFGDNSVDSIVTDPPYGLSNTDPDHVVDALTHWLAGDRGYVPDVGGGGFMGKAWDKFVPPPAVWDECFRVLKPGGPLLSFAGTRTIGLMEMSIRLARFEIRDSIAWLYGSGFPKSLDVSKAIDKMDATEERRARALEFTAWMRSTGITGTRVDALTNSNMGGHYLTEMSQPAVATADLFDLLRPELPEVPERIEELVRQRTVESQNYAARPITQEGTEDLRPGETITFDQRASSTRERRDIPHTPEAEQWSGWGTALKPAFEPVVVARKPLAAGTVAANVLQFGTGALNIDACRIEHDEPEGKPSVGQGGARSGGIMSESRPAVRVRETTAASTAGRWPANVCLDADQAAALDEQSGTSTSPSKPVKQGGRKSVGGILNAIGDARDGEGVGYADSGGASRFFYVAKAPKKERPVVIDADGKSHSHATVKPLTLMRWLVRLATPPGGTVLDPFAGSGTTVEAALLEGFTAVGIELGGPEGTPEFHHFAMIQQRVDRALAEIAARPTPETAQEEESIPA